MLKTIFNNLEGKQKPCNCYALFGWYMFYNFDKFVKIYIPDNFQELIIEAWRRYRNGKL